MIERSAHVFQNVPHPKIKDMSSQKLGKEIITSYFFEVGSSDEATLLDPINHGVRDARMASKERDQPQPKKKRTTAARHGNEEIYHCAVPGCGKGFVNKPELDNHVTVWHQDSDDDSVPPLLQKRFPIRSKPVERRLFLERLDDKEAEQTARPPVIPDSALYIPPVPQDIGQDDVQSEIARSVSQFSQMSMSDVMPASSSRSLCTDSMALESDVALSDIDENESQEVQRPARILVDSFCQFAAGYMRTHPNAARKAGDGGQPSRGRQDPEGASTSGAVKRSSSISSSTPSTKHPRDEDDEDGARKKPKPSQLLAQIETIPIKDRPLACPFNKFDNIQFGEVNKDYHVCATWNSVKTAYLKQHLQRSHCPPPHSCPRCQEDCKTAAALLEHQRQEVACTRQQLDKQKILPQHQDGLGLRNRNAVGQDRESYWFLVFETLFPGERETRDRSDKKLDPYYRGPAHEVLERFLRFSELNMRPVLSMVRQQLKFEADSTPDRDADLYRMILQEASQLFMHEMSNAAPIDLRQLEERAAAATAAVQDTHDNEAEETVRYNPARHSHPQLHTEMTPSEADFTQMGQSTNLSLDQFTVDPSATYRDPYQRSNFLSRSTEPNEHLPSDTQSQELGRQPELYAPTFEDFEQIMGPSFDQAIEATEMFTNDPNFPDFMNVGRTF